MVKRKDRVAWLREKTRHPGHPSGRHPAQSQHWKGGLLSGGFQWLAVLLTCRVRLHFQLTLSYMSCV